MAGSTRSGRTPAEVAGVTITHPDRVVYPERGLTKLDVARHYLAVAPRMLPHVRHRPLSLVRCPDGTAASCFYQKHWQGRLPEAIRTVQVRESSGKSAPYVVVHDAAGLVTLAQWGVIEVHPWPARADRLERPDRITFDLDPGGGVAWGDLVAAARQLRDLLVRLGLVPWAKTTGGKGIHVVVPIARTASWEVVSGFARAVAEHLAARDPERFLARAARAERTGRIFVDWLRNTRGATAVAPWSPRARASAGVSVPVSWAALGRLSAGDHYAIGSLPSTSDAWAGLAASARRLGATVLDRFAALA